MLWPASFGVANSADARANGAGKMIVTELRLPYHIENVASAPTAQAEGSQRCNLWTF